ncbi:MAG: invasion associated locus B family protein [Aliivibrio sp.]|uniref:invasion associated locus B family protein n=1 Tax=Aliivibrio sp. TaxID=1872443 RepID=UPI001A59A966|nr:invasion associated locus B family protein [Aliivibrio sp.]
MKNLLLTFIFLLVTLPSLQAASPAQVQPASYGSWSYDCTKKPCFISQILMVKKGEQASIAGGLSLLNLPKQQTLLTVRVSALAAQKQGLGIKIDNNKDIRVAIEKCNKTHCEINILADKKLLSEMENGRIIGIFYINKNSQKQVSLPFSLQGFPDAFQQLKSGLN